MENEQTQSLETKNPFPFNNLFLIKGYTTGKNDIGYYLLSIAAALLGYLMFQSILVYPLISAATQNGISMETILKDPNILFNPDAIGVNRSIILALMMGMFVFTLLFFASQCFGRTEYPRDTKPAFLFFITRR